jgi:predicted HD phosphohydrolase
MGDRMSPTEASSVPASPAPSGLITRMDRATVAQWRELAAVQQATSPADRVITALRSLDTVMLGFPVSQLTHCLQTATRAERAGADTDMVIGSLCHDIGKVLPGTDHCAVAAQVLRPYVRPDVAAVVGSHWAFQLRYTSPSIPGSDPEMRRRYVRRSWYALAEQFSDEWDQAAFDPEYDTLPLEHFEDRLREVFGRPRRMAAGSSARRRARRFASRLRNRIGV